jgi:hypothetical protein
MYLTANALPLRGMLCDLLHSEKYLGIMNPETNKAGMIKNPYEVINPDHQEYGRSIYYL